MYALRRGVLKHEEAMLALRLTYIRRIRAKDQWRIYRGVAGSGVPDSWVYQLKLIQMC